jgi:hypothetical protein
MRLPATTVLLQRVTAALLIWIATCLGTCQLVGLGERVHGGGRRDPADDGEDLGLEQVLAVEGDVQEEPRRRGAEKLQHQMQRLEPGLESSSYSSEFRF